MQDRRLKRSGRSGRKAAIASAAVWASMVGAVNGQNLTDAQVGIVVQRLAEGAKASWELGTRCQALIEFNAPSYSVVSHKTPLPPSQEIPSNLTNGLAPVFNITHSVVSALNSTSGPAPLIEDGSAADPASLGFAVLLSNWTNQDSGKVNYAGAAKDQLDYLYQKVPKTSDGAFSHRVSQVQLWSDFVYMVPPFLAYYGVMSRNRTYLEESYNQIKLYRSYLLDTSTKGLWKHVLLGSGTDEGHWSTGNGWAAAGMLRVLGTISNSEYGNTMKNEQKDLGKWINEIHTGMYSTLDQDELLFTNYADQPSSAPKNFYDAASTALLAATVYRYSLIWGTHHYLPLAEKTRLRLSSNKANATQQNMTDMQHFDSNGWLTPVVNPHSYGEQGAESPEAQAFVVEMHSAWRDWVEDGSKGANGGRSIRGGMEPWIAVVVGVLGAVIGVGVW